MAVTGMRLERLLDVNPQEALPRGVERPHLPGAQVRETVEHEIEHMRHLYSVRTRPELHSIDPDAPDASITALLDGWHAIARAHGRLLYDCAPCRITWPVLPDATHCPTGHRIPTED